MSLIVTTSNSLDPEASWVCRAVMKSAEPRSTMLIFTLGFFTS